LPRLRQRIGSREVETRKLFAPPDLVLVGNPGRLPRLSVEPTSRNVAGWCNECRSARLGPWLADGRHGKRTGRLGALTDVLTVRIISLLGPVVRRPTRLPDDLGEIRVEWTHFGQVQDRMHHPLRRCVIARGWRSRNAQQVSVGLTTSPTRNASDWPHTAIWLPV